MDHLVAALAARRFHLEGATKSQIAAELGVSRFKVAKILEDAVRDGVVRIEVVPPADVDLELSSRVARHLGLRQAVVVRAGGAAEEREQRDRLLGLAAREVLAAVLSEESVLGVSWGRTLYAVVDVLRDLRAAEVVQLVGSPPGAQLALTSVDLVRRLGEVTRGVVHPLHVPLTVADARLARGLREDPQIAATTSAFSRVSHALVGIGAFAAGTSSLHDVLPDDLVGRLVAGGAVGDVCCTVVDADGRPVAGEDVEAHCLAIGRAELARVPDVTAVAGGVEKAAALRAVARSGLVHRLITDSAAAETVLDLS
ncbi:sugar-binding transcriptional regulator [Kineococcus gynurae]|uniref:Sugar-binding transcriptional regulator n=1 Tax=Kineococcus gynurae TaxID=452979 RepID=A0ABV5LW87_9ACTN